MQHMGKRLQWSNPRFSPSIAATMNVSEFQGTAPDCVLFVGLNDAEIEQPFLDELRKHRPKLVLSFETLSDRLDAETTFDGYHLGSPSLIQRLQARLPWSRVRSAKDRLRKLQEVWKRHTSDDMLYVIQSAVHHFLTQLPEMTEMDPGFDAVKCIGRHCRQQVFDCLKDTECRKALDCLATCGMNDQVCSYRCIASYESKLLESFSLCILQKHNCLGNFASIPRLPHVEPMMEFRGVPLTHEMAEEIFIGQLGDHPWSWKIAYGKNPAYDYFPCQFQLFYRGRGKGVMWYDPVFQVITLDGRRVWRRRHYRVKRAIQPGSFHFSVLDNGVTSNEFWRIVDADEHLHWALFYYAGAASAAGINYTGAVLGTVDGRPPKDESRVRIALERCGIEPWELSKVDYSSCDNPPLEIQSMYRSFNRFLDFSSS